MIKAITIKNIFLQKNSTQLISFGFISLLVHLLLITLLTYFSHANRKNMTIHLGNFRLSKSIHLNRGTKIQQSKKQSYQQIKPMNHANSFVNKKVKEENISNEELIDYSEEGESASQSFGANGELGNEEINSVVNQYLKNVLGEISRKIDYPKEARESEIVGVVQTKFTIDRAGKISNIIILNKEVNSILQKHVIQKLNNLNGVFPIPNEVNLETMTIVVPLNFNLLK